MLVALAACTPANLRDAPEAGMAETSPYAAPAYAAAPPPAAPVTDGAIPSSEINQALFGTANGPATGEVTSPPLVPQPVPGPTTEAVPPVAPVVPAIPAATDAAQAAPVATDPTQAAAAPAAEGNALGISDTQDFKAVSARESIESNKARIEADKASYQQIQPTALPERDASAKVSAVVAYAISAPNRLGQAIYDRSSVSPEKHQAACMAFTSEEAAQEAFLKAGGPKRDPKKLDPDGDGFACKFDPTPFQQARG